MAFHLHYISCSTLKKYGPDGPLRLERLVPSTNGMGWGVTDWTGVVRTNHRDEMLNVWNSTSANIPMLRCRTSLLAAYKEFISHEREFKIFTVLKSPREAPTPWNVQAALWKCRGFFFSFFQLPRFKSLMRFESCTHIPFSTDSRSWDYSGCQISRKLPPFSLTAIIVSRRIQLKVQLHKMICSRGSG